MTETKKWTLKQWKQHLAVNAKSSYGLSVCLAALVAAEGPEKGAAERMTDVVSGLSGFQGEGALGVACKIRGSRWLSQ